MLLLGVRAAADHGVKRLRVEGDSILVIRQVRGIFATRSTRLRRLRNGVKAEIARLDCVTLHHVDRQANGHADRLANQALDRRRSLMDCEVHPVYHFADGESRPSGWDPFRLMSPLLLTFPQTYTTVRCTRPCG